jgi:hypothetical protein
VARQADAPRGARGAPSPAAAAQRTKRRDAACFIIQKGLAAPLRRPRRTKSGVEFDRLRPPRRRRAVVGLFLLGFVFVLVFFGVVFVRRRRRRRRVGLGASFKRSRHGATHRRARLSEFGLAVAAEGHVARHVVPPFFVPRLSARVGRTDGATDSRSACEPRRRSAGASKAKLRRAHRAARLGTRELGTRVAEGYAP